MKKFMMMMAAFSLLTIGMVSCNKNDDTTNNLGDNNQSDPTDPTADMYVDLGLSSGLLWAKCNLGAQSPEDAGNYYAWGETTTKQEYSWQTYIWCSGTRLGLTKYCCEDEYGQIDNLRTLQSDDDAASRLIGYGACIPSKEQWDELLNQTDITWETVGDVYGCRFTSRTNGQSIFLPAAGYYEFGALTSNNSVGGYWSSTIANGTSCKAYYLRLVVNRSHDVSTDERSNGRTIRAVRSARK